MSGARFGLRTTISLHGTVVHQEVAWCPRFLRRQQTWRALEGPLPCAPTETIGRYRWSKSGSPIFDLAGSQVTEDGDYRWVWSDGQGVRLVADRIEMKRARRRSSDGIGDLSLLVLVLTLMVGMAQLNFLLQAWLGANATGSTAQPPSPELIARLLQQELDGESRGVVARTQRADLRSKSPSFYMPAGSAGPADKSRGGQKVGEELARRAPTKDPGADGHSDQQTQSKDPPPRSSLSVDLVAKAGFEVPEEEPTTAPSATMRGVAESIERFIGWGFHDWIEASSPETQEVVRQLELARALMRLNPDEPYAILTVAYFAYLSENYTLCQDLYRRYTTLFPEDAAGWNNLALTYKRVGQYTEEERLYRRALALDPQNSNTQNNLAVNLAHQGRFHEAESLMDGLAPSPRERPYANLHRAKIAAAQGKDRKAVRFLRKALSDVDDMDTFHHIEFRQDIRLDPALGSLRKTRRVQRLLRDVYGEETPIRLGLNRDPPQGYRDG